MLLSWQRNCPHTEDICIHYSTLDISSHCYDRLIYEFEYYFEEALVKMHRRAQE